VGGAWGNREVSPARLAPDRKKANRSPVLGEQAMVKTLLLIVKVAVLVVALLALLLALRPELKRARRASPSATESGSSPVGNQESAALPAFAHSFAP
jgi:hypothetical protein